ncbi:hypothetical protein F4679DRAFT_584968 [Xylaria curta]|nr:hypothetical protein F4679DRAFT_584968 [Xylaria curta]
MLSPVTPRSHAEIQSSLPDPEKEALEAELASLRLELTKLTATLDNHLDNHTTLQFRRFTGLLNPVIGSQEVCAGVELMPALSFQTQVGDEEEQAWYDSEEERMKIGSQLNQGLSADSIPYEFDTGEFFASHMDIDEELQPNSTGDDDDNGSGDDNDGEAIELSRGWLARYYPKDRQITGECR